MTTEEMRTNHVPSKARFDGVSVNLTVIFSIIISVLASIPAFYFLGIWSGVLTILLGTIVLYLLFYTYFFATIQKVPESYEWIIEFMGGFYVVWAAGGHMYFPFFGWIAQREEIFLGEDEIELFPEPKDLIDLEDASCHFRAAIVYKVKNSLLAVYNIDDYKDAVRKRVAGLLRSHLSKYTLDKANEEKHELDLGFVISGSKNDPDWKSKPFYLEILDDWGVELLKLMVFDLELTAEDIAARRRKQEATINKEVAVINKDIKIINAEGDAEAIKKIAEAHLVELKNEGLGIQAQIEALVKIDKLTVEAATALVTDRFKWSQIGDKALIIDSGNGGTAGEGAKFGAGMQKGSNL